MSYLALDAVRNERWKWIEMRRLARIRRMPNLRSDGDLLSLSAYTGVQYRPDDGGRQLPSSETIANYWLVEPDDLVFNPMWAIEGGVAVSSLGGAVSTAYRVYELGPQLIPRFAHHFFRSLPALVQYRLMVRGVTTFDRSVTREDFEAMPVPVPPRSEQCAIADFLDAETARIDALIDKKRRMIDLFAERLRLQAFSLTTNDGASMPLRRCIAGMQTGTTPPENELEDLRGDDEPWYSPGDVGSWLEMEAPARRVSSRAVSEGWVPRFQSGSTVIVGIGATAGRMVAHISVPATGNQQMTCLVSGPRLRSRFLSWQLWARTDELRGTAPHTTLLILNNDFLRSFGICVPDLDRQEAIAVELDALASAASSAMSRITRQIALLAERRQALITAAVTGELSVPGVAA